MARRKAINPERIRHELDTLFQRYHHPDFIGSDPLLFVHRFARPHDQEIAGLIASALAYGNVTSINHSIQRVLTLLDDQPHAWIMSHHAKAIARRLRGFRHRWTSDLAMTHLLTGMQRVIADHGSLGQAFQAMDGSGKDLRTTLSRWVELLQGDQPPIAKPLLADPQRSSACKRLHLYLRWMSRRDRIDPGCWHAQLSPSRLMIPLDTHVFAWAKSCGITRRAAADFRAVEEITAFMRRLHPDDPVRYDFALTRPGIIEGWRPHHAPVAPGSGYRRGHRVPS